MGKSHLEVTVIFKATGSMGYMVDKHLHMNFLFFLMVNV